MQQYPVKRLRLVDTINLIMTPAEWRAGQPGEQWTMFFTDDSGNALEFKAMTNPENLFAKYVVE